MNSVLVHQTGIFERPLGSLFDIVKRSRPNLERVLTALSGLSVDVHLMPDGEQFKTLTTLEGVIGDKRLGTSGLFLGPTTG